MTKTHEQDLIVIGATIIDGVEEEPRNGLCILTEGQRIKDIGTRANLSASTNALVVDATGKFIIPGLMNANVHLLGDSRLINLTRYLDHYEDLILESAQVALMNGITTVFDTWGPRRPLMAVRDAIDAGSMTGSRIFCAGNIIGLDGPLSADFFPKDAEVAGGALIRRINSMWVENVGRQLMWQTPERVASEVRAYIDKGIDFVKYASNDHFPGAFLAFSGEAQRAIVEQAHRAGVTAQAHTMSVEGLRLAVEAGCDLIQHANITGPTPIPEKTLEMITNRNTGAVVFPWTTRALDWIMTSASDLERTMWEASDANARNLIRSGAKILLGTDGTLFGTDVTTDPLFSKIAWGGVSSEDSLINLSCGNFNWFRAMEEKGCAAMEMLRAATSNIAEAYGKGSDLGTLERGKIADFLILDKNPLQSANNYRTISAVVKDGVIVDRGVLPVNPIFTKRSQDHVDEEASYLPFLGSGRFPICAVCANR